MSEDNDKAFLVPFLLVAKAETYVGPSMFEERKALLETAIAALAQTLDEHDSPPLRRYASSLGSQCSWYCELSGDFAAAAKYAKQAIAIEPDVPCPAWMDYAKRAPVHGS